MGDPSYSTSQEEHDELESFFPHHDDDGRLRDPGKRPPMYASVRISNSAFQLLNEMASREDRTFIRIVDRAALEYARTHADDVHKLRSRKFTKSPPPRPE